MGRAEAEVRLRSLGDVFVVLDRDLRVGFAAETIRGIPILTGELAER